MHSSSTKRTFLIFFIILSLTFSIQIKITIVNSLSTDILGNPIIDYDENYFDAYNMFILERRNMSDYTTLDKTLYIVDMEGNIFLEKDLGTDAFMSVEFINSSTLLYGNYYGACLWNLETDKTLQLGFKGHHEYERNEANNTFFTFNHYFVENDGITYAYDSLAEYTAEGILVWSVNTSDFIPFSHWCPFQDLDYGGVADLTHSNSIVYDEESDVIFFNCRNTNTFYKINHKTGELIWSLGEHGDFEMRDIHNNIKNSLFYHGHALEIVDDNTFIYFDNDEHNQTNNLNHRSRIIEITFDESTMTANITFEFSASKDYHSAWWGDSDRLPNGNRLGTFGTHGHEGRTDIGARLVEINGAAEIVWEMYFPKQEEIAGGVYRMERISFSPFAIVDSPYWIKSGEKALIRWDAFYNYRNKDVKLGNYEVYLGDELIDQSDFEFEKYWLPTSISTDLGFLDDGIYNITFSLFDESGHNTLEQIELYVSETPPEIPSNTRFHPSIVILSIIILSVIIPIRKRMKEKINCV